ncbi:MAG TPA: sulfur carrier protein ThiS [Longimicrobiales bacterium]|nr:sulfur carrier protein ThiS [Longimicrobiales bacterium]
MMITVTVNGEERQLEAGVTVAGLLGALGLHPRLVVVEHNREILDAGDLEDTEIQAGDNVELVHFVGGG